MSRLVRQKSPQISNTFLDIPKKPLWAPAEPNIQRDIIKFWNNELKIVPKEEQPNIRTIIALCEEANDDEMKGIIENTNLYFEINHKIDTTINLLRNIRWTEESMNVYNNQLKSLKKDKKKVISSLVQEYQRLKNNKNANITRAKEKLRILFQKRQKDE